MACEERIRDWSWVGVRPTALKDWGQAPDAYGFYEIGYLLKGEFMPMYGGRAAGSTLKDRLEAHYKRSHVPLIAAQRDHLWYRCKSLSRPEVARFVEALHLAAMEYPWNRRNEWAGHWAREL